MSDDLVKIPRSRLRPTIPCAGGCGRLLWWHRSTIVGRSTCLGCRRAGRGPSAVLATVPCPACGQPFVPKRTSSGGRTATCSRSCGQRLRHAQANGLDQVAAVASRRARDRERCARRRARQAEQLVEVVDPDVVFERDGWRCHACGLRIDRRLSGLDPMGPTIDHLVPLVAGGEHSYRNVAAAHRRCNIARGARGPAQLALIG